MLAATAPETEPVSPLCHRADPRDPLALDRSWWLCHARSRSEKALAAELLAADVPHLLPLRRTEVVTACRHRRFADVPVFPSYLFLAGDDCDYLNATRHRRRIVHLWPVFDVPGLVSDLANLLAAIESGAPIGKARPAPKAGDRFRVVDGPWEGMEGTLIREACGATKMVLCVHALGQGAELNVDAWRVEAIEGDD